MAESKTKPSKSEEKVIDLSDKEKKALNYVFNVALKSTGTDDGGVVLQNVIHFSNKFGIKFAGQE